MGGPFISNFSNQFVNLTCSVAKDIEAGRIKRAEVMLIDRSPVRVTVAGNPVPSSIVLYNVVEQ